MFTPAPMDESFVPYTQRPMRKNNSRLFVNGGKGRGRGAARVIPQSAECAGRDGAPCGPFYNGRQWGVCVNGECKFTVGV